MGGREGEMEGRGRVEERKDLIRKNYLRKTKFKYKYIL